MSKGEGAGAHSEFEGAVSRLGDVRGAANRRRRSSDRDEEDGDDGGSIGPLRWLSSMERRGARWRRCWTDRGGKASAVGTANGVGGDGAPLGGGEREPEKGGRRHGESARPGRVRGVADGVQGDERKQEVARGKQEVAEASRARATPRLCSSSWQRRKMTRGRRWAGPARWAGQLGHWRSWAGSGGLHG